MIGIFLVLKPEFPYRWNDISAKYRNPRYRSQDEFSEVSQKNIPWKDEFASVGKTSLLQIRFFGSIVLHQGRDVAGLKFFATVEG